MVARHLVVVGAAIASSGCVVAVPPSRLEVGAGGSTGPGRSPGEPTSGIASIRASVHPLQIDRKLLSRPVDFGFGYLYDGDATDRDHRVVVEGGFFEASAPILTHRMDSGAHLSLDLRAQGRVLVGDEGGSTRVGPGAALQITGDIIGFADGGFAGSSNRGFVAGYSHGEGSLGFFVEGGYGSPADRGIYTMTAGLMCRIPATVAFGVGF